MFLNKDFSQRVSNEEEEFLSHLAKAHEDWQIKQADLAIKLCFFKNSQTNSKQALEQWKVLFKILSRSFVGVSFIPSVSCLGLR